METRVERCLKLFRGIKLEGLEIPGGAGEDRSRGGEPATVKQFEFLKKLGVEVEASITKQEASKRIDYALQVRDAARALQSRRAS
jgi:hypothetical protein